MGSLRQPGVRLAIAHRLEESNPAGLMHGAVVTGAMFAIFADDVHSATAIAAGAGAVLIIYWLTHAYTDSLVQRESGEQEHLLHRFVRCAGHQAALLKGGLPALVTFAGSVALSDDVAASVTAAIWVTLLVMAVVGYLAAHAAGIKGWRLAAETVAAALVGGFIVALNTLLH